MPVALTHNGNSVGTARVLWRDGLSMRKHEKTPACALNDLSNPQGTSETGCKRILFLVGIAHIVRAVISGVSVGLVPFFLCRAELAQGELIRLLQKHVVHKKH